MLLSAVGTVVAVACSQSDAGITTAVKSKFASDDTVKAYQIDVDTSNKVVTLSGNVETAAAREQAVLIARQTNGVRDVVDHLNVNPAAAATTGDLKDDARELGRDAREESHEASETAKEAGRDISDQAHRAGEATKDAAHDAKATTGQTIDRAEGAVGDAAITTAVKSKLLADNDVSGLKIDVDTSAGIVTLNGTAKTRAEVNQAMKLARETDGVKRVVDNIKVGR